MTTLAPPAPVLDRTERPTTLKPVIDAIDPSRYDNPTWKGLAYLARDLVLYAGIVAGLLITDTWWAVLGLWMLSAFVVSGLFIIGHDAAHGALFKSKALNSFVGHVTMLPSWHVYEGWVLGHNRIHHGHTARQSMDFVWHPLTPKQYHALGPIRRLRHRIEWSWLGSMPYYLRDVWWNKMIAFDPPAKWKARIRRDRLIIAVFLVGAGTLLATIGWNRYGTAVGSAWVVFKVLVMPFLAFTFTIGWVVHVHHIDKNIQWWKRREWNKFRGQVEGTTILVPPVWVDFFLHRIFFHVAHHVDMRIPFYELPAACADIKAAFPDAVIERRLRLGDFLSNTRQCKLYDFDAGRWLTYAEGIGVNGDVDSESAESSDWSGTNSF